MGIYKNLNSLTQIERLNSNQRIKRILKSVKDNKIVLLEGRLTKTEETDLIRKTMEEIDKKFKGIELATIENAKEKNPVKKAMINMFLKDRTGMTIIGPATIVKEIKKDPDKIELFTKDVKKKK